ncbi:MAG: pyruvate formate lyase-activating protein [Clostridia bacterium]|nr:pyruvate formate lyase-activating protein [Clostridia bacterium]
MIGRVHSIQSMAAVDGPGVRFAVFLQGCHLRCGYCHNPDTWDVSGGTEYTAEEIVNRCERYREYFGECGGITLSGGEPLLQADFVCEVFSLCRECGINTCLDTSGSVALSGPVKDALRYADRVLLDIKFATDELYRTHVGCGIDRPLEFLAYLNGQGIPTTVRQVIVPGLNDDVDSIRALAETVKTHGCVDKTELLPLRKMCRVKYEKVGIEFPFDSYPEPTAARMAELQAVFEEK